MLHFLFGADSYRSHQELLHIKKKFLSDRNDATESFAFDFSDSLNRVGLVDDFIGAIRINSLFSAGKFISAKRIFSLDERSIVRIATFLEENGQFLQDDKDISIVFWDEKTDKRTKLCKLLIKICSGSAKEFLDLKENEVDEWIEQRVKFFSMKIDVAAKRAMIDLVGINVARLDSEIMKLSTYCHENVISREDVKRVVSNVSQSSIFDLLDAACSNNKKLAMNLLHKQLSRGADPLYLLSMYAYHIRNIINVGAFAHVRVTDAIVIARETKLHPFVVKKTLEQLRIISLRRATKIFKMIARLDVSVKTGQRDGKLALAQLVVKI